MIKKFIFALGVLTTLNAFASTLDCNDLYVGAVTSQNGMPPYVVFKNERSDSSGSYTQYFTGWSDENVKSALSLLLAAKMSGHRVNVRTTEVSGCDIQTAGRTLKYVQLSNNP